MARPTALWRIATLVDAGAIHPIRDAVIQLAKMLRYSASVCFGEAALQRRELRSMSGLGP